MSEDANKSSLSGNTNHDNLFLSQIPHKKQRVGKQHNQKLQKEKIIDQEKLPFISPLKFISLEEIEKETKRSNNLYSSLEKNINQTNLYKKPNTTKKKCFSIHLFDFSLEKLPTKPEKIVNSTKNVDERIIFKYINYKSPKNYVENKNFMVKLYEFENKANQKQDYEQLVKKWKKNHNLSISKGLLLKKKKPTFIKTSLTKEEISLKKIDIINSLPSPNLMKQYKKPNFTKKDSNKHAKNEILNHFEFNPEALFPKSSRNIIMEEQIRFIEKFKLSGPNIFKKIKKKEKILQEITLEGKGFQVP